MKKETKIIHTSNYKSRESLYGSINPPIVRTSTVAFESYEQMSNPPADKVGYGRYGIEPMGTFRKAISDLEGAYDSIITSCGVQAVSISLIGVLKAGDHVLIADNVYGPAARFGTEFLTNFGIEVTFFDSLNPDSLKNIVKDNTKAIFFEVPASLTMEFPDIDAIVSFAKKHNLISIIDNTWGAGYLFKPLDLGVDISVQAITKYVVGHADTMMGSVAIKNKDLFKTVQSRATIFGISVSPDDIYLALRGLKTLAVRLNQHHDNAMKVIAFLDAHPLIDEVFCPALSTSPGYEHWKKHCTKTNGLISFTFKENYDDARIGKFIDNLKFFPAGYSWGGFESIISIANPIRSVSGWDKNQVIRLHIGLEASEDIIEDLDESLKTI